ncbi:hypothetical protein Y032_0014g2410 [Ancylostoma ceylanicum]|uniref:Uncharacterized protein n=1 Tax=Ancylostoma ceylanicum TaxID=53326 RepID=A0A016V9Z2_9BILA|nr:hypothetical protein Y032_0014g2410 [Ancylostoma ceylanicum]
MSLFYIFLAFLVAVSQRCYASYPVMDDGDLAGSYPYIGPTHVMHAAPILSAPIYSQPMAVPYGMASFHRFYPNYYRPRSELRNIVGAYSRENGHISDTAMTIPFRSRKRAAARRAARLRKNLKHHKRN